MKTRYLTRGLEKLPTRRIESVNQCPSKKQIKYPIKFFFLFQWKTLSGRLNTAIILEDDDLCVLHALVQNYPRCRWTELTRIILVITKLIYNPGWLRSQTKGERCGWGLFEDKRSLCAFYFVIQINWNDNGLAGSKLHDRNFTTHSLER